MDDKRRWILRRPKDAQGKPNRTSGWDPCPAVQGGRIRFESGRAEVVLSGKDADAFQAFVEARQHPMGTLYDLEGVGEAIAGPKVISKEVCQGNGKKQEASTDMDRKQPNEDWVGLKRAQTLCKATPAQIAKAVEERKISIQVQGELPKQRTYYKAVDCERFRLEKGA